MTIGGIAKFLKLWLTMIVEFVWPSVPFTLSRSASRHLICRLRAQGSRSSTIRRRTRSRLVQTAACGSLDSHARDFVGRHWSDITIMIGRPGARSRADREGVDITPIPFATSRCSSRSRTFAACPRKATPRLSSRSGPESTPFRFTSPGERRFSSRLASLLELGLFPQFGR